MQAVEVMEEIEAVGVHNNSTTPLVRIHHLDGDWYPVEPASFRHILPAIPFLPHLQHVPQFLLTDFAVHAEVSSNFEGVVEVVSIDQLCIAVDALD